LIVQSPSSDIVAAKGPDVTLAPGSDVPEKVTTRLVTVSPLLCDLTLIGGGVVSRAFVVVGAAVVGGAVVGAGASFGSMVTGASEDSACSDASSAASACVVDEACAAVDVAVESAWADSAETDVVVEAVVVAGASVTVVAMRDSGSVTRSARTAEATLADASGWAVRASVVVVPSA
jgi:hypothetical protein